MGDYLKALKAKLGKTTIEDGQTLWVNISIINKPSKKVFINATQKDRMGGSIFVYTAKYENMVPFNKKTYPKIFPKWEQEQSKPVTNLTLN